MNGQSRGWFSRLTRRPAKKRRAAKWFVEHLEIRDLLSAVVVNTISDTDAVAPASSPNDSSGNISLRSAIEYLNANGGGSIDFAASLDAGGPATITLGGTELAITQALTISGPGASLMTINAKAKSRIFDIDDGKGTPDINVEIDGLTLTGGNGVGMSFSNQGGAVYNAESLTLANDTISGNTSSGDGGGIFNAGTLAATNDTISGNTAGGDNTAGGGGICNEAGATLTSTNDTISGNTAGGGGGAGIYNDGTLTSTKDTISANSAHGDGGGVFNQSDGTLTSTNDAISGNSTGLGDDGGGILNDGMLTSTNDTITGNSTGSDASGGGIDNYGTLTTTNDTVSGNSTDFGGGGIFNNGHGTLTSTNDTITGNSVVIDGGGICNNGTAISTNDTISGNTASQADGGGGGIFNAGTLTSTNDTISGNSAVEFGGGISNSGTLTSANDTISGNTAVVGGGSGGILNTNTLNLANSIVVGNKAPFDDDLGGKPTKDNGSNLIGLPAGDTLSQVLATDSNGKPLLANNGGPTQTIALAPGSPAIGKGAPLATLSDAVTDTTSTSFRVNDATYLAVGDALKLDSEIVLVTAVSGTTITVTRGADGTTVATHASGADLFLAFDQRGLTRNANPDIGAFETQVPTVSITVQNASQVYSGAADPVSANVIGLNSATIAASPAADIAFTYYTGMLTAGQVAGATPLTGVPVNVGSYTVVAHFMSDVAGYRDASSPPAYFTITKAALTYQIQNDNQSYGRPANLAKDLGTTIATGINGETLGITYTSAGDTATANVGAYGIKGSLANGTGQVSNYNVTLESGTLTVNPLAFAYQIGDAIQARGVAADLAKDLGTTLPTGINNETLSIAYSSTGDTASAPSGQYPIYGAVSDGSGLASNYAVTLKPGTLTVGLPPGVGYLAGVPGDGTPQTFVRNLYRELFGREPSAVDLAYWSAQVQADSSILGRDQVLSFFMSSPEYKAHYVDTLYEVFLGRAPDAAGLQFWAAKMGNPGTPGEHGGSADERFILAAIVGSDEFYAEAGGTDQSFVQALYHDLLGRAGDVSDVNAWANLVHSQEQNRDGIVRNFLDAPETEHMLLDRFYPLPGGTAASALPAPGALMPDDTDDLATVTGLGWENLYLQGPYGDSPEGNDAFFTALAGGAPWDDVQQLLLASDQFYSNSNRPLTGRG